ncbi:phosphoketolase family protein [Pseudoflavonifractor sp. DSM 107456]|uniref:Probable phosphoketolase n=1 Tax=Pseudoflavonifractor gallinarum TaxID=2779352 RepID=A0ABR9RC74_9FIRM|nr:MULTISPECIES: phosphoketolase family protein [Eubacteriales]MBE5056292.1 phosphoketolase family protein [Pseudoflavonifractor gallinarum]MBS5135251.1 phosphoketolase family protein [Oscillospiraceae bacterium]
MSKKGPLTPDMLRKIDAYWRAANYLAAGQLYLLDNPLLRKPLQSEHLKKTIVGHWGTVPGQNFIYTHLNRIITKYDLNMIYLSGPGHGGNAMVAQTYLEGTYSEIYPNISQDLEGMKKLFKQFSFPGGIASHVAPETPGSINEGGELGYSLAHAFGAVLDNPTLIAACVVGDGEAETGPLATAWHSNKFLNPVIDGAVLPILHLNGFKISNPTIFSRITHEEVEDFFKGCGWTPRFVEGDDPVKMHQQMAAALDWAVREIDRIQQSARTTGDTTRPRWPMIVFRSPKGWTGPKEVDGLRVEGTFRAHQVPISIGEDHPEHLKLLENWLKSYHPEELFDRNGTLIPELQALAPKGDRRMGANPHANGGLLLRDLRIPDFREYAVDVPAPGEVKGEDMTELGKFVRDILKLNAEARNFRVFGPDETMSNRLGAVFHETNRCWNAERTDRDEYLAPDGRIMDSMLSEHMCQGWLEGYLLTGRHGIFNSYEAFIRIVDSMFAQHAKWLKVCAQLPWRQDIASLNYVLSSNVWQQDHNGFTHQDPGFLDHVANKKADVVRLYLPPDGNCLLSCFDHCIRSRNYVNVLITSKHPRPQWLTMDEAIKHCTHGIGIWQWASNDQGCEPDVVMACCGETPTLETLAAVTILHKYLPELKIRVINVVDLMKLQPHTEHPHGLTAEDYDALFTVDKPIIFAFHGYPTLIHELTYRRHNKRLHVRGYKEEGTITTPFDMRVQNDIDRFHLVEDVVKRLPQLGNRGSFLIQLMKDKLVEHKQYIITNGIDMPEVRDWKWNGGKGIY